MNRDSETECAKRRCLQRVVRRQQRKHKMKIQRLRLTIEPWHIRDTMKELRVEAIVDGTVHTAVTTFEDNDFISRFDYLMEKSRREIVRLVKAHGAKTPNAKLCGGGEKSETQPK